MTSIYGTFPSTTEVEAPRDFFQRSSSYFVYVDMYTLYIYAFHIRQLAQN